MSINIISFYFNSTRLIKFFDATIMEELIAHWYPMVLFIQIVVYGRC